jgi:hypothetical protein
MTLPELSRRRLLIVAKTYPELSSKYGETVCTAAVDEDGNPLRLYPIPFRYLQGPQRFQRYQWVSVSTIKNVLDTRPESHRVDSGTIVVENALPATADEWGRRAESVFRSPDWQYSSMDAVLRAQRDNGRSLAFVRPTEIVEVRVCRRTSMDAESFEQKLQRLKERNKNARKQLDLFESTIPPAMKHLEFIGGRVCVKWRCSDERCPGHSMQILDWEICELARKSNLEKARKKVESLLRLENYHSGFFLGNFFMYPASFAIIGLWYPPRKSLLF